MSVLVAILMLFAEIGDRNRFELTDVKFHDADTCTARINLPWKLSITETIRASNYDALEVSRTRKTVGEITDGEIAKGKEATAFVSEFIKDGRLHIVPNGGGQRDNYGRILGELWLIKPNEQIDLADVLRVKGYLRPVKQ